MLAELNFLAPMAVRPKLDITGGGRGNLKLDARRVELADADSADPAPTVASHGFGAVPFSAAPPDGDLDFAYRQAFAKLCAAAVKAEIGASVVIGVPMAVQLRRSTGIDHEAPISVSHTDFTPGLAARRATEVLAALKTSVRPKRFAAFNTWWLARPGPQDRPLALCDATSIAAPDLQVGRADVLTPDKATMDYGEIAFQRHSARHRWYWYPNLAPDRLLVFCGFDSDSSRPSMVTHCAFTNPDCPPGTPPRVSVECRCFAFW